MGLSLKNWHGKLIDKLIKNFNKKESERPHSLDLKGKSSHFLSLCEVVPNPINYTDQSLTLIKACHNKKQKKFI
jgi:hypothetical protein